MRQYADSNATAFECGRPAGRLSPKRRQAAAHQQPRTAAHKIVFAMFNSAGFSLMRALPHVRYL
jgi:hypothetical protein